jgi:hypothetical protein
VPSISFEPPRALTAAERSILGFVIEANADHREALRALLRGSKVTTVCSCGCGSLTLTVDQTATPGGVEVPRSGPLPGEAVWKIDGMIVSATLWIGTDGASLDIESLEPPTRWPRLDELQVAQYETVVLGPGWTRETLTNFSSVHEGEATGDR